MSRDLSSLSLSELRQLIRSNQHTGPTSGLAKGYLQANLAIMPADWATDFLLFCQRNPVACPLIGMTDPGSKYLPEIGAEIDISTDVPEFHIFRDGKFEQSVNDLNEHWRDDLVTFVLGCSFSFEDALQQTGLKVRNIEQNTNVSMYDTSIACKPAGRFSGNYVVSMRPFIPSDAIRAIQVTSRFPMAHGAPIHFGDPALIGIKDISQPQYGEPVSIYENEVPVFWACGVTPQNVIRNSKPPFCITHAPGKMLITNRLNNEYAFL
ncbi:putative hydro-lyase [Vibrio sp.]|uniref:Putative hydro-lyase EES38_12845 n=1 Tax=Vibrio viridaestus TaxID=2487322 RepID=A0A3N9TEE1_9VIBR|nr:putative hydro-lyase [Vibrio viridaestus]MDC0610824.1 putative hydro-lyase [Vibrio sp.]RQW62607.1 putative hydro-lyase [Vibrio viridaestus]